MIENQWKSSRKEKNRKEDMAEMEDSQNIGSL